MTVQQMQGPAAMDWDAAHASAEGEVSSWCCASWLCAAWARGRAAEAGPRCHGLGCSTRQCQSPLHVSMGHADCATHALPTHMHMLPAVRGPARPPPPAPRYAPATVRGSSLVLTDSEPSMYLLMAPPVEEVGELPLNGRASWLAGRPVRGEVLLSLCRLVPLVGACLRWRRMAGLTCAVSSTLSTSTAVTALHASAAPTVALGLAAVLQAAGVLTLPQTSPPDRRRGGQVAVTASNNTHSSKPVDPCHPPLPPRRQAATVVTKWRSYGAAAFWRTCAALFPSSQFRLATNALLLRRMPTLYRWVGARVLGPTSCGMGRR